MTFSTKPEPAVPVPAPPVPAPPVPEAPVPEAPVPEEPLEPPVIHDECLSCSLPGCTWVDASRTTLSPLLTYIAVTCLGPGPPNNVYIFETNSTSPLLVIKTKEDTEIKEQKSVKEDICSIHVDGVEFYRKFTMPSNFDRKKIYPVIFEVYGGPSLNMVTTKYLDGMYSLYFAGHYEAIVVRFDPRGTPGRSDNFQHAVYKKLGQVEVEDSLSIIKRTLEEHPFLDESRVGIFGGSYGGYLTLRLLEEADPDMFAAALTSAAVADWRFYDTAYTERYMGLVDDLVYARASAVPKLGQIPSGVLMILHGLSDYNVVVENHWLVIKKLIEEHVQYREYVRPGEDHNVNKLQLLISWFDKHDILSGPERTPDCGEEGKDDDSDRK